MSETKHTPRPWIIRKAQRASGNQLQDIAIVAGGPDHIIAEVFYQTAGDTFQPVESNAYLIASAPDILATLKRLIPSLEARLTARSKDVEAWDLLDDARHVIAAAEGRQVEQLTAKISRAASK